MLQTPLRMVLDLLKPSTQTKVGYQQSLQKSYDDTHSHVRQFQVGPQVVVCSYHDNNPSSWVCGKIFEKKNDVMLVVEVVIGSIMWTNYFVDIKVWWNLMI